MRLTDCFKIVCSFYKVVEKEDNVFFFGKAWMGVTGDISMDGRKTHRAMIIAMYPHPSSKIMLDIKAFGFSPFSLLCIIPPALLHCMYYIIPICTNRACVYTGQITQKSSRSPMFSPLLTIPLPGPTTYKYLQICIPSSSLPDLYNHPPGYSTIKMRQLEDITK